jgi:SAM-dependent methyltransferase
LRAAGVSDSLKSKEPLLASLISPFIRDNTRVMIGGSADPGVLCAMGRLYSPSRPAMTVIDRCRAPLELIREFTVIKGLACRTLNLDLLDLDGSEQWDQIVLHYTPDFMEPQIHGRLFRSLARSLAPGGTLVCAAMTGTRVTGDDWQELESVFFNLSWKALQGSPLADLIRSSEFEQMLQSYAAGVSWRRLSLPTSEDLRESLRCAGLHVLSETTTPQRQRSVEGAALVDSNSIVVAGH